jgi:putative hydrolase of the HAD superfamily
VTNGSEEIQTGKLDALGIQDAFDATVFCDPTAGIDPKPDPTPVTMAVDDLGVAPEQSVLVGDDHGADVAGAHNADARSAWVPYLDDPTTETDPEPTHVFDSMTDVAAVLER